MAVDVTVGVTMTAKARLLTIFQARCGSSGGSQRILGKIHLFQRDGIQMSDGMSLQRMIRPLQNIEVLDSGGSGGCSSCCCFLLLRRM